MPTAFDFIAMPWGGDVACNVCTCNVCTHVVSNVWAFIQEFGHPQGAFIRAFTHHQILSILKSYKSCSDINVATTPAPPLKGV